MAGSYPDVPGRRMGWDQDGTIALWQHSPGLLGVSGPGGMFADVTTAFTTQEKQDLQDEEYASAWQKNGHASNGAGNMLFLFIFPELRDLDGFYPRTNAGGSTDWLYDSADTTNGFDGTWGESVTFTTSTSSNLDDYRDTITSFSRTGKRSAKYAQNGDYGGANAPLIFYNFHLYGEIAASETPDRLLFVDEITSLEYQFPKDYGDVPRGSAREFEMRLKNNSGSLTANTVSGDSTDFFGGSGAWYTFDVAGGGFSGSYNITSIGNGASSGLITVRQVIPDDADVQVHAGRHEVAVSS